MCNKNIEDLKMGVAKIMIDDRLGRMTSVKLS